MVFLFYKIKSYIEIKFYDLMIDDTRLFFLSPPHVLAQLISK